MVTAAGGNHGQYLFDGNKCMNRFGDDYLSTGALPSRDSRCGAGAPSRARAAKRRRLGSAVR